MHLSSCLYPKVIRNKYTGERVATRCNKCSACLNAKAKDWINRLDQEMQANRFCYMVNLTYDNENVPRMGFTEDLQAITFINRDLDWCIPIHELTALCKEKREIELLRDRLIHPLGLPVCCPDDISKFYKRFNKYCYDKITHKYENIRYFCTHELGPTTFRCHTHMLVFFNDRLIANRFQEILRSCWKYGNTRAESVYSRGGRNYVAQYVNMSSHLPTFYQHHRLKPRPQFSKSPTIGSLPILGEKIWDIYERLPMYRTVWNDGSKRYDTLPMPSSYNNRFFEKCPRYSELSHHDRVVLYGATNWIDTEGNFEGFKKNIEDLRYLRTRGISNKRERIITDYCDFVEKHANNPETLNNSLRRIYALSLKFCWYASRMQTSIDWLVSRIEEYWKRREYENLKEQYRFQEEFCKFYDPGQLIHMYPTYVQDIKNAKWIENKINSPTVNIIKENFSIKKIEDLPELKETLSWKSHKSYTESIYKDTHKRHEINAYLYSRKLKQSDPQLQKILIKYFTNKQDET